MPCHYTNFKIKHVADIGVTGTHLVNSLASHLPIYSVKRTSIGKDKILSSRGNAEGPYSPWAISSSSLSQTETDSSSFCSVEDRGAGYSSESQRPRGIFGFPDEFITTIRYVDVYTLTSASNGIAKQYMRMNSLFDPDQTGTGHQPYYLINSQHCITDIQC